MNWANAQYHKRRERWINLLGGKCVKCGSLTNLEFDHIDPSTKTLDIGGQYYYKAAENEVLTKCQLLCHDCHFEKSMAERGGRSKHGTSARYSNYRCRCEPCRLAWNAATKRWKAARKARLSSA